MFEGTETKSRGWRQSGVHDLLPTGDEVLALLPHKDYPSCVQSCSRKRHAILKSTMRIRLNLLLSRATDSETANRWDFTGVRWILCETVIFNSQTVSHPPDFVLWKSWILLNVTAFLSMWEVLLVCRVGHPVLKTTHQFCSRLPASFTYITFKLALSLSADEWTSWADALLVWISLTLLLLLLLLIGQNSDVCHIYTWTQVSTRSFPGEYPNSEFTSGFSLSLYLSPAVLLTSSLGHGVCRWCGRKL